MHIVPNRACYGRNLGFWLLLHAGQKKKITPVRTQMKQPLPAHREKMGQYSWEEAQFCPKAHCSELSLLSVHFCTLKMGFLQVLQPPFFPELCECKNICCILSRQMLCFLLIKIERREQIVQDEALCCLGVLKK